MFVKKILSLRWCDIILAGGGAYGLVYNDLSVLVTDLALSVG